MLGLITGTGFYSFDALTDPSSEVVATPFGEASLTRACWKGGPGVVFLPRHGGDHSVPPHAINFRANLWALKEAGASRVLATAVSGGIADGLTSGTLVLIDDFLDFTHGRPQTFFDQAGDVVHTDMSEPYDPTLRAELRAAAAAAGVALVDGGTYCATNGPRFETKAEIAMMHRLGGALVGMTGCPEVVLANELGLPYASIGVISNRAAGLSDEVISVDDIMAVLASTAEPLERILDAFLLAT